MIRLCVGCDTIEDLLAYRRITKARGEPWWLWTRQTPKAADRLTDGGSLYRIFKGMILCRQRILAVETVAGPNGSMCRMTLDEEIIRTEPTPRRAFQGWRYLEPEDAPSDLTGGADGAELPPDLARRLREAGAW
jgi:hypothetical protein